MPSDAYFPGDRRSFLAGLMNWDGDGPPTAEGLAGCELLAQGWAHVRTIQANGRLVLGQRDLDLDGIRGLLQVTHRGGGRTVMVYEGATPLREASREEAATMELLGTWGVGFISKLAERAFVAGLPPVS